jgi:hypothetical protein
VVDVLQAGAQVGDAALRARALLLEVGARGEAASRTGDDHGAHRVVLGDGGHRVEEIAAEPLVPGVEGLGPVEEDLGRRVPHGQVDRLVGGHG